MTDYDRLLGLASKSAEADRAFGSVFGAFLGDAAGAVLELSQFKVSRERVKHALTLPGGGALGMGPGQITDDSEMALCIMHGLLDPECRASEETDVLNLDGIAHYFGKWSRTAFDIGFTTREALMPLTDLTNKRHL